MSMMRIEDEITLLRNGIGDEHQLVGHRMAWLVTSQAFLFSSVVFRGDSDGTTTGIALRVVCAMGLLTSLCASIGVVAALSVANTLARRLRRLETSAGLSSVGRPVRRNWTSWAGNVPPLIIPPAFVGSWILLLVQVCHWPAPIWVSIVAAAAVALISSASGFALVYRRAL